MFNYQRVNLVEWLDDAGEFLQIQIRVTSGDIIYVTFSTTIHVGSKKKTVSRR